MLDLKITILGHRQDDLEVALGEVTRLVQQGCLSGMNSNDTGRFNFDVKGDEVAYYRGKFPTGHLTTARYDTIDQVPKNCLVVPFNDADAAMVATKAPRRKNKA
jgi:hypothetical protein